MGGRREAEVVRLPTPSRLGHCMLGVAFTEGYSSCPVYTALPSVLWELLPAFPTWPQDENS